MTFYSFCGLRWSVWSLCAHILCFLPQVTLANLRSSMITELARLLWTSQAGWTRWVSFIFQMQLRRIGVWSLFSCVPEIIVSPLVSDTCVVFVVSAVWSAPGLTCSWRIWRSGRTISFHPDSSGECASCSCVGGLNLTFSYQVGKMCISMIVKPRLEDCVAQPGCWIRFQIWVFVFKSIH